MFLLVGLGNPGLKYQNNRHNIGYMAVDDIVRQHSFGSYREKFCGQISSGTISSHRILALKPTTFMNESGRSVHDVMRFYKIKLDNVLVVHDELDLSLGKLRIRTGGGFAGHNGLLSIGRYIGSEFSRLRIGIGHPGKKELVNSHVLGDFTSIERPHVNFILRAIGGSIVSLLNGDKGTFMNKLAQEKSSLHDVAKVGEQKSFIRKKA